MAKLFFLRAHQISELFYRVQRVYHAAWIIRRIHYDSFCMRRNHALERIEIYLEILGTRGHDIEPRPHGLNEAAILWEERRKCDEGVSIFCECLECDCYGRSRTARHEKVLAGKDSAIMSKKLAMNADCLLLDVKYGSGAFMKTREDAQKLADLMERIGKAAGKKCRADVTDMNSPLGRCPLALESERRPVTLLTSEVCGRSLSCT